MVVAIKGYIWKEYLTYNSDLKRISNLIQGHSNDTKFMEIGK